MTILTWHTASVVREKRIRREMKHTKCDPKMFRSGNPTPVLEPRDWLKC